MQCHPSSTSLSDTVRHSEATWPVIVRMSPIVADSHSLWRTGPRRLHALAAALMWQAHKAPPPTLPHAPPPNVKHPPSLTGRVLTVLPKPSISFDTAYRDYTLFGYNEVLYAKIRRVFVQRLSPDFIHVLGVGLLLTLFSVYNATNCTCQLLEWLEDSVRTAFSEWHGLRQSVAALIPSIFFANNSAKLSAVSVVELVTGSSRHKMLLIVLHVLRAFVSSLTYVAQKPLLFSSTYSRYKSRRACICSRLLSQSLLRGPILYPCTEFNKISGWIISWPAFQEAASSALVLRLGESWAKCLKFPICCSVPKRRWLKGDWGLVSKQSRLNFRYFAPPSKN